MQAGAPRFHGLDTLRSLAILAVIAYHLMAFHGSDTLPAVWLPVVRMGWMGVDLFFVLSGFLIASQLLRPYLSGQKPSLRAYYRNRLFRILPVYLVVLALYYFVPVWPEDHAFAPAWQYLTFTLNLFLDLDKTGAFTHAWSLCVEEHFYLFLPLIVMVAMRKPSLQRAVILMAGFVVLGMVVRGFVLFHVLRPLAGSSDGAGIAYMERIYYPTYSRLDGLLAGVTLALIRRFRQPWWEAMVAHGHRLLALGVGGLGIAVWLFADRFAAFTATSMASVVFGYPLAAASLALIVASALSSNGLLRHRVPGAEIGATLAYSLYLTHKEIIHLVDRVFPAVAHAGMYPWLAVYAVCCLVVASVLYGCVERPFLLVRGRF